MMQLKGGGKRRYFISAAGRPFGGSKNNTKFNFNPALNWNDKIECPMDTFFIPTLKIKHDAISPLPKYDRNLPEYEHPYLNEIKSFMEKPAPVEKVDIEKKYENSQVKSPEDTPCHWVDTKEQLAELISKLKTQSEIAIDVENHDLHSYTGYLGLVQISTYEEDFLIDPIELHDELWALNEVTSDPKIMKIFHSANSDIVWLQRDFSVYVVNMFDTSSAMQVLGAEKTGLAHLMEKFCKANKDKKHQRADWRVRPLSEGMIKYARSDTHYLLFIKDNLVNELIEKSEGGKKSENLLAKTLAKSNECTLVKYQNTTVNFKSFPSLLSKFRMGNLAPHRKFLMYSIFRWRDNLSRKLNKCCGLIVAKKQIKQLIAKQPKTYEEISKIVQPRNFIKNHHHEFVELVLTSKAVFDNDQKVIEFFSTVVKLKDKKPRRKSKKGPTKKPFPKKNFERKRHFNRAGQADKSILGQLDRRNESKKMLSPSTSIFKFAEIDFIVKKRNVTTPETAEKMKEKGNATINKENNKGDKFLTTFPKSLAQKLAEERGQKTKKKRINTNFNAKTAIGNFRNSPQHKTDFKKPTFDFKNAQKQIFKEKTDAEDNKKTKNARKKAYLSSFYNC